MPRNPQPTTAAPIDPPAPLESSTVSGRAIVIVLPTGPYSAQDYADSAAEIMRVCSNWPTPAPQLAEALRRAVSDWADAQALNH